MTTLREKLNGDLAKLKRTASIIKATRVDIRGKQSTKKKLFKLYLCILSFMCGLFVFKGGRWRMCGWVQVTDERRFSMINGPGKIDSIMARIVAHSNIVTMDPS